MASKLPATGDKIPASKLHVSKTNVRYSETFGLKKEDQVLIYQVGRGKTVVQPFKARPENEGYGVFVGRRRYLAKVVVNMKKFTEGTDYIQENSVFVGGKEYSIKEVAENLMFEVGKDVIITDISEEKAKDQSLIENLGILREDINPITRAKVVSDRLATSVLGVRELAGKWGIPHSTLSDWLAPLELVSELQEAVEEKKITFTDSVKLARMGLGEARQKELAEVLHEEGKEGLERKVAEIRKIGQRKRGIPGGKYIILRTVFDRVYPPDMEIYQKLEELAKKENMKVDEYTKKVLRDHVASKT